MKSNAKKILLISSDQRINRSVKELSILLHAELDVREHTAETVVYASANPWNLIIIHASKKISSIFELCRHIKSKNLSFCQIIVVSEVSNLEVLAGCLNNGADDFIIFPWNTVECFARATAAINRVEQVARMLASPDRLDHPAAIPKHLPNNNSSDNGSHDYIFAGDVRLCPLKREISIAEQVLQVTRTEFLLFSYLAENITRPCSSTELLRNVLGYDDDNYLPSLHSHVSRLRRKIKLSRTTTIETIWCYGYRVLTHQEDTCISG